MRTMTPDEFDWPDFCRKLEKACNFKVDPDPKKKFTWECDSGRERSKAVAILKKLGDVDISKTLEYFSAHGGHCDCEILFNVDPVD